MALGILTRNGQRKSKPNRWYFSKMCLPIHLDIKIGGFFICPIPIISFLEHKIYTWINTMFVVTLTWKQIYSKSHRWDDVCLCLIFIENIRKSVSKQSHASCHETISAESVQNQNYQNNPWVWTIMFVKSCSSHFVRAESTLCLTGYDIMVNILSATLFYVCSHIAQLVKQFCQTISIYHYAVIIYEMNLPKFFMTIMWKKQPLLTTTYY